MVDLGTNDKAILVLDGKNFNIRRARSFFSHLNLTPELTVSTSQTLRSTSSPSSGYNQDAPLNEAPTLFIINPGLVSKRTVHDLQKRQSVLLTDWQAQQTSLDAAPGMMTNVTFSHLIESSLARNLLQHFIKKTRISASTFSGWGYRETSVSLRAMTWHTATAFMKNQLLALPKLLGYRTRNLQHVIHHICLYLSISRGIKPIGTKQGKYSFKVCQDGIRNTIRFEVKSRNADHVYRLAKRLLRLKPEGIIVQATTATPSDGDRTFDLYFIQRTPIAARSRGLLAVFEQIRLAKHYATSQKANPLNATSMLVWLNMDHKNMSHKAATQSSQTAADLTSQHSQPEEQKSRTPRAS